MSSLDFFGPGMPRLWVQLGARPGEPYDLVGCGEAMGVTLNLGEPQPVICQSRTQRNKWEIVGMLPTPPELHDSGIRMQMPAGVRDILRRAAKTRCAMNLQLLIHPCETPEEKDVWTSILLYERAYLSSLTWPNLPSFKAESTEEVIIEGPMKFEYFDTILPIRFAERATDEVVAEVLDGVFCGNISCGDCGPYTEGCEHFYAITRANTASPGLSSQLVYSNDLVAWEALDIPPLGGVDASKIVCIGSNLVIVSEASGSIVYAPITADIDPEDFVEVPTGFVAFHGPRCIYVKSPSEVFIGGAAGYVYYSDDYQAAFSVIEDGALTAEDINGIDGDHNQVVVAVATDNTVLLSTNNGETFEVLAGPAVGSDLNTVCVIDAFNWFVGGDGGAFYRTNDQGASWIEVNYQGAGVGAIVHDIEKSQETDQVLMAAIEIGGVGYAYRSVDGGNRWRRQPPHVDGIAATDAARLRFVAICPNDINVAGTGGLAHGGGTDGFLAIAS